MDEHIEYGDRSMYDTYLVVEEVTEVDSNSTSEE